MIPVAKRRPCWSMSFGLFVSVVLGLNTLLPLQGQQAVPQKPRIDPAGISGTLILSGKDVPSTAIERFVTLAGGKEKKARLVVLHQLTTDKLRPTQVELEKKLQDEKFQDRRADPQIFNLSRPDDVNQQQRDALQQATGVWLTGGSQAAWKKLADALELEKVLASVLKRGGVVSGSSSGATLLAEYRINPFAANGANRGLGLLSQSLVGFSVAKPGSKDNVAGVLARNPGLVGYEIEPNAALLVRGRDVVALGEGKVTIHLAECSFKSARQIMLRGKKQLADLTALCNAAQVRAGAEFPPQKPEPPVVEKGTLIIVGGGGLPKGMVQKFVELAGGDQACIVVFPTAQPDPLPNRAFMAEAFKKAGAKKVTVLKNRKLEEVESKEFLDTLREATGIWFDGGRQWRFVDAYLDTKAHALMHEVLARGGVIGGSSAGASIQGEYMPRGDPLGNLNIIAEGYEKGLGFLKGVGIDQHFSQRKRQADMTLLMKAYPQLLGIGIDETTAIVVQGHVAEVIGTGKVFFYDGKKPAIAGHPDYDAVGPGGRYDLKWRVVLDKGQFHGK